MAPRPFIPTQLKVRPFTIEEARAAGVSRYALRGKSWRRLSTGLYCWTGVTPDLWMLLCGWSSILPAGFMFSGPTSAWLHGLPSQSIPPTEVIVPPSSGIRTRGGLTVRHADAEADRVIVRGLPATSVLRTLCDLSGRQSGAKSLELLDAALFRGLVDRSTLLACRRLLPLAELAEPAESPMETRLRWVLIEAGLPRPQVQAELRDARGRFVARADLFYSSARLVIEYDGMNHRDRLIEDDRRQNLLVNAGFKLLRFTAADINQHQELIEAHVRRALGR